LEGLVLNPQADAIFAQLARLRICFVTTEAERALSQGRG